MYSSTVTILPKLPIYVQLSMMSLEVSTAQFLHTARRELERRILWVCHNCHNLTPKFILEILSQKYYYFTRNCNLGILDFVDNKHAGIIPRALAHVFEHAVGNRANVETTITVSFLQLYRETIQDLLSAANMKTSSIYDENLQVREDPLRGFYVDGLQVTHTCHNFTLTFHNFNANISHRNT
jgi:Kinesin motor domain